MLTTILSNSPDSGASTSSPSAAQHSHSHAPNSNSYVTQQSPTSMVNGAWPSTAPTYPEQQQQQSNSTGAASNGYIAPQYQQGSQYPAPTNGASTTAGQDVPFPEYNQSSSSLSNYAGQAPAAPPNHVSPTAVQIVPRQSVVPPTRSSSATLMDRTVSTGTASWAGPAPSELGFMDPVSVYKSVTKPYDYTEGYHFLMKHLPVRSFDKNDILRIVRALAIYRPSLIALQMPMSEEDEVFVEKCFQRSLVELDKLVSFSGTPTLAWRRTGEICLVGPEFCMLTGWEREELLGRKKFVYELFENQSVVEYWENFANHAFENTTQSVYSHCVLLKPSGVPVPCTFCFSIRRDIMDLPSLVIGQWLPLL